jgi:DNA-binding transcriptional LysR family regulator
VVDVDSLRYVVALAQELHFGRAAARCFVAEGHFGRRIRRLERELGTRLFDRTTRRVALTEDGVRVVAHARATLASLDELRATARGEPADDSVLRLGVLGFGLADRWRCFADGVLDAVPRVRMVYQELDLYDQYNAVRRGAVDVGLVQYLGDTDGLVVQPVLRTPRVAVVPASSPLAGAECLTGADVAECTWLGFGGSDSRLAEWAGSPTRSESATCTVRRPSAIPSAVATTGLIGLHGAVAARYFPHPDVRFVPIEGASVDVGVATRQGDDRPAIRAVRDAAQLAARAREPEITTDPIHNPTAADVLQ